MKLSIIIFGNSIFGTLLKIGVQYKLENEAYQSSLGFEGAAKDSPRTCRVNLTLLGITIGLPRNSIGFTWAALEF